MKKNLLIFALIVFCATVNAQQLKVPQPSPLQTLDQAFALSNIKIEYSRPSMKGRTIFGDVVPFDKIWRTGANASTKVTFGESVKIQDSTLKAGTYALYTIPGKDSWEVMFYKDLTLGGNVADYKKENEVLRLRVKPVTMADKMETFTILVSDITASTAKIELLWDKTRISIPVSADIEARILKNIEDVLVKDNRPYFQGASYYYENNKDLNQALAWVNKAAEQNPQAYWVHHLKAKIQLKLNDKKGAIATAQKSLELAKADNDDAYVKMNEKLIEEAKK